MRNLCIIPARGGSKRILRKNIKEFLNKPIIAYSIETALKSNLFNEVMVSTEDDEIANVAIKFGARVPFFRSTDSANDFSTVTHVLNEVIDHYQTIGQVFENACCLYATAPLTTIEHIKQGFEILVQKQRDTVIPITPFTFPIWRGLKTEDDEKVKMIWPEFLNSRSQDLQEVFHDAGQWYWFSVESFIKNKKLFNDNTCAIILDQIEVQDIDNLTDWKIAELKYAYLQSLK